MNYHPETPTYDVLVVGAGPAGCEASLAAASAGMRTLCLTINLDTTAYPPATPSLIDGPDDPRVAMLEEMEALGVRLPDALGRDGVIVDREPGGRLLIDRRLLGLAYKELLENEEGLELRQALVTGLDRSGNGWLVSTGFGEKFHAACVIVAAGTFLGARVEDGGVATAGGRIGEIPSNALADCLREAGLRLVEVEASTMPRLDGRQLDNNDNFLSIDGTRLLKDGNQLGEFLGYGLESRGNRNSQLVRLRKRSGLEDAWITRSSYSVYHHVLAANQVGVDLETQSHAGLFFAGRAAGSCNYLEAAALGLLAGRSAAAKAVGAHDEGGVMDLTQNTIYVSKLCLRIARQEMRPVTVRTDEPGC